MTEDEMPGLEELKEKWMQESEALRERIATIEEIGSGPSAGCDEITTPELCEKCSAWADELTIWLFQLWDDLYGSEPGTVDPPPKPPFRS